MLYLYKESLDIVGGLYLVHDFVSEVIDVSPGIILRAMYRATQGTKHTQWKEVQV